MKKLLGILVLGLFLITPSQADDIRDFQIEGMSIGDSLLDYFSEEEILADNPSWYKDNEYSIANNLKLETFQTYEIVQAAYKTKDKKYILKKPSPSVSLTTPVIIRFRDDKKVNDNKSARRYWEDRPAYTLTLFRNALYMPTLGNPFPESGNPNPKDLRRNLGKVGRGLTDGLGSDGPA